MYIVQLDIATAYYKSNQTHEFDGRISKSHISLQGVPDIAKALHHSVLPFPV